MPLLSSLLILIVLARLLGELFARFQQPVIVGEMLAGVFLGPALLNLIQPNASLAGISELAVFLVVLSAGLEMDFKDVIESLQGRGLLIAFLGFIIPLSAGILVGVAFQLDAMRTVFLGLCVSITALPVAIRILEGFKLLNTQISKYAVAASIINDLAALLALGVILDLPTQRSFKAITFSIFQTSTKLLVLAGVVLGFNYLLQKAEERGVNIHRIPEKLIHIFGTEALFGIVVVFVLVFGSISEALGFHFIIGAFFGALLINKDFFLAFRYSELEKTINSVTNGFLAPVYFAYIGLEFNLHAMHSPPFVLTVLVVSILSKILAGIIGGRLAGISKMESFGLGIILNGRGVMGMVVASIAFEFGFIDQGLFSTLVLMVVVTTMMTPLLFKKFALAGITKSS